MDNYNVSYSPLAIDDSKGIYAHIAFDLQEKQIAEKAVNKIRTAVKSLNKFPKRYEKVSAELKQPSNMHRMVVGNFLVFYLVDDVEKEVCVVRILYGKQNLQNILN